MSAAVLDITGLVKDHHGLRPLRMARLTLAAGDRVALLGLDATAAEVVTTLITGAITPDSGSIHVLGLSTSAIQTSDEWLALVDRMGVVTDRAVLLDPLTAIQNLAMPFTLSIDPPSSEARERAEALAREVGLPASSWQRPVGELDGAQRVRVRLGRALALDPALLILEHPTATVDPAATAPLARDIRAVADARRLATLTLTADVAFARAVAATVMTWIPADGSLRPVRRSWLPWGG